VGCRLQGVGAPPRGLDRAQSPTWGEAIVTRLMAIVTGGSDADALRAAEALMSRVYGRPTERVETTVKRPQTAEDVEAISDAELEAYLVALEEEGKIAHLHVVGD
jgi:hypothetical protein